MITLQQLPMLDAYSCGGTKVTETDGMRAVGASYGVSSGVAAFFQEHVSELRQSENPVAARCGEVLRLVGEGWQAGLATAPIVVGIGQRILGNPLAPAVVSIGSTNPVAQKCGAIGAIYYGWSALSDAEKRMALDGVSRLFDVGVEFVRGIVDFTISTLKSLLNKENLAALRYYVAEAANIFGRTFADVTGKLSDRLAQTAKIAGERLTQMRGKLPAIGRAG